MSGLHCLEAEPRQGKHQVFCPGGEDSPDPSGYSKRLIKTGLFDFIARKAFIVSLLYSHNYNSSRYCFRPIFHSPSTLPTQGFI